MIKEDFRDINFLKRETDNLLRLESRIFESFQSYLLTEDVITHHLSILIEFAASELEGRGLITSLVANVGTNIAYFTDGHMIVNFYKELT
jgi:hypothetical protein